MLLSHSSSSYIYFSKLNFGVIKRLRLGSGLVFAVVFVFVSFLFFFFFNLYFFETRTARHHSLLLKLQQISMRLLTTEETMP